MPFCKPQSCVCCYYSAPLRHVTAVLLLCGVIVGYTQRVSLNITIVEMVPPRHKSVVRACPLEAGTNTTKVKNIKGGTKDWSEQEQAHILTSFYFGYAPGHLITAWLLHRFGTRYVFLSGMLLSTITTVLIPAAIKFLGHYGWVVALRVLMGIGQSVLFSSCSSLMSRWIPSNERALMGAMVYSGNSLGTIVGTLASGMLVRYFQSWPIVYYMWAIVGGFWLFMCFIYVYSDPTEHPFITPEEKIYLQQTIAKKEKKPIPLKAILSDKSFWGLLCAQFGNNYILFTILSNIPKYMNEMLNYKIKDNAMVSSFPHVAQYLCSLLTGVLADHLIKRKNVRVSFLRKTYAVICILFPSISCLMIGYSKCNRITAVGFLIFALMFKGFFYTGPKVNSLDLTSNFAGTIMALQNGFGAISGAVSPYVVSQLAYKHTFDQWNIVFWIMFGLCNTLVCLYCILGTGKRAKWDYSQEEWDARPKEKPKVKWYKEKTDEEFAAAVAKDDQNIKDRREQTKLAKETAKEQVRADREQKKAAKEAAKAAKAAAQ